MLQPLITSLHPAMTINKLTSKLTVKRDLAVLLQYPSSRFFLFQQSAHRLYFLVKAEILGPTWGMMLMWKSPRATKVIQSFLQCRRSCIWHLHLVKSYSKENSEPFSNGCMCASHWELQLLAQDMDRNSVTTLYVFNKRNLHQFRCLFITKYIGLLACSTSPFLPVNNGQKSLVIILIYYLSFHDRV